MSAEIIQFIPRANPARMTVQELEAMGLALINAALDPMQELITDNAPAEWSPGKDSV